MAEITSGVVRTHNCGELTASNIGKTVTLCGWINKYRNLGGLYFIDLRDKYGVTQLSFDRFFNEGHTVSELDEVSLESVIKVEGVVASRPEAALNKNMVTGEIELQVTNFKMLSTSDKDKLPFLPFGQIEATEDLKLKYRYLDLRTNKLQNILKQRSEITLKIRNILNEENFIEVETPILYKSTPEGARDYIVPSRVHPGSVYALPQSPQTLKQLLMIGGTDRYFQICKCFRDEDLRADRQPEFTQIDIEASYISQEYIINLTTKLIQRLFEFDKRFSIPRMSYNEAMNRYGSDKPDLRFGLEHFEVTDLFKASSFSTFESIANSSGLIKAIFIPEDLGTFSRKNLDQFNNIVKPYGGKGVAFFKVNEGKLSGGISKFIDKNLISSLNKNLDNEENGTWLFFADSNSEVTHACADIVRRTIGHDLNLITKGYKFIWIYDFPLLEWSEEQNRFIAKHHPFTMPKESYLDKFLNGNKDDLLSMPAEAYDLVCNGYELGGGSMRIYDQKLQSKMFEVLGMSEEEVSSQFGFFIEALQYGTPPHGGIAFGLDRIIMVLAQTDNIRDVIAFPKTTSASDLMSKAPSVPDSKQTHELNFDWLNS